MGYRCLSGNKKNHRTTVKEARETGAEARTLSADDRLWIGSLKLPPSLSSSLHGPRETTE